MVNIDPRRITTPPVTPRLGEKVEPVGKPAVKPKGEARRLKEQLKRERRRGNDRRMLNKSRSGAYDMRSGVGRRKADSSFPGIDVDV